MFYFPLNKDSELRLLETIDAEELFALTENNRHHLRRWLPWVDRNKTVDDSRQFIESTRKQLAQNQGLHPGIWYQGQLAGIIGQHGIDWGNRSTSIGYWLGKDFEGKGLITLGCKALIEFSFKKLGLNRVEIRCAVGNKKSQAVPLRLGFKKEGVLRRAELLDDTFTDHVLFGLLAEDWD